MVKKIVGFIHLLHLAKVADWKALCGEAVTDEKQVTSVYSVATCPICKDMFRKSEAEIQNTRQYQPRPN